MVELAKVEYYTSCLYENTYRICLLEATELIAHTDTVFPIIPIMLRRVTLTLPASSTYYPHFLIIHHSKYLL